MDFLILPDHPAAQDLIARTPALAGARTLPHASGRPWLVGHWDQERDPVRQLAAGQRRLAVFGHTALDEEHARAELARASSPFALDALARSLPGAVHLVASLAGTVRAQGAVSTARHLFTARVAGVTVAASSPGWLAALTGAPVDERALAARLLTPYVPWPLSQRPVWRGVDALTPGHWLLLEPDGRARSHRWWRPPPPELPLGQAAEAVRAALYEAVAVRAGSAGTLSADLSGGLDSTSLCFVADALRVPALTYHATPLGPRNTDAEWAASAARLLGPSVRHTTLTQEHSARLFALEPGPHGEPAGGEGPLNWRWGGPHLAAQSRTAASDGSRLHLMGLGGDELFGPLPVCLWSMLRGAPLAALPRIRRRRLLNRWPLGATLRGLADSTGFPRALTALAGRLTAPPPRRWDVDFGWTGEPRMPPWATPEAVALVRGLLTEEAARGAAPLDRDRYLHQVLEFVVYEGTTIRQTARAMAWSGVGWEAPFLDDRVLEAALSVRLPDRMPSDRFKPLLVAAMRGTVPGAVLDRTDKGEFSAELYEGLRLGRAEAGAWCAGLRLGAHGLARPDRLRAALLSPPDEGRYTAHLETTVAVESWLRSGQHRPVLPAHPLKEAS